MILNEVYKIITICVLVMGVIFGGVIWHNHQVNSLVTSTQKAMVDTYNANLIALQNYADSTSLNLLEQLRRNEDAKKAEIASINSRHSAIVASVSNRTSRPTGKSSTDKDTGTAETPEGGTGIGLYREDSTFLAGEAARAELIRAELFNCYKNYDTVKSTIDTFVKDNANDTNK